MNANNSDLEHAIERTLRALGDAEPAPGFTDRLKASLNQPVLVQTSNHRRRWLPKAPRLVLTAACLCGFLLVAVLLHRLPMHSTGHQLVVGQVHRPSKSSMPSSQANSEGVVVSRSTAVPAPPQTTTSSTFRQPLHSVRSTSRSPVHLELQVSSPAAAQGMEAGDAQALADFQTPSFPAPLLPPTAQERAVRLMLRRGEQHDLAQLDPQHEDVLLQQEHAAFARFFEPPVDPALRDQPRSLSASPTNHTR